MQKKLFFIAVALMGMTTIFGQTPNYQGIIYVTSTGAGTHSGDSWANATSSIADAQAIAQAHNAVVWVAAGTYYGDTTATAENAFTMVEGVNVYGGFVGNEPANYDLSLRDFVTNETILDGDSSRRVLYQPVDFYNITMWDGFTIRNGRILSNGYGDGGGGVCLQRCGKLNCCVVKNNMSRYGGGCRSGIGSYISNCRISNNTALSQGGGVHVWSSGNISNCLISNNTAGSNGGGVFSEYSVTITNSTIVRNFANNGSGICVNHGNGNLTNSIVWGNGVNEVNNISGGFSCSYSAIEGGFNDEGEHNIFLSEQLFQNPLFVRPSQTSGVSEASWDADWHLQNGSLCINHGNNAVVTDSMDLSGTSRIKCDTVDMGCYESDYYSTPVVDISQNYTDVIYVTQNGSGTQTGENWANATSSLSVASALARTYHADIWVATGIYFGDTTATSENAFIMVDGVNVYGGFSGDEPANYNLSLRDFEANPTILDGQNTRRVLLKSWTSTTDTSLWDGFTIQNGLGARDEDGCGVYMWYGILNHCKVHDCAVSGISGGASCGGGGISALYSLVKNCLIYNNSNRNGGGISAHYSTISNCRIYDNTSSFGGGVELAQSHMSNCIVNNNRSYQGGGIYSYSSSNSNYKSTISNCLITNNSINNSYVGWGGGIAADNNTLILNSTIVRNYGVGIDTVYRSDSSINVINCIVWGNEWNGIASNISGTPTCTYSAVEGGYAGEHNIDISGQQIFVNPSLTAGAGDSTGNVDWHLLPNAVCINQGNNSYVTDSTDLDGLPRIGCNIVDMGCYEFYRVNHVYQTVPTSYTWHGNTYTESGDYPWLGLLSTYCDSLEVLHLTVGNVGVDNPSTIQEETMRLYPNPTTGVVNVQLTMNNEHLGNAKIQVFDIYGKLVGVVETLRATSLQTGTGASAQTQIDLSRYANGVYFIKAVADGNVIGVRKVVKQ